MFVVKCTCRYCFFKHLTQIYILYNIGDKKMYAADEANWSILHISSSSVPRHYGIKVTNTTRISAPLSFISRLVFSSQRRRDLTGDRQTHFLFFLLHLLDKHEQARERCRSTCFFLLFLLRFSLKSVHMTGYRAKSRSLDILRTTFVHLSINVYMNEGSQSLIMLSRFLRLCIR